MDWWKEVARMCLNFAVLTVGAFCYTTLTGLWNERPFFLGLVTAVIWILLSWSSWKRGGG